MKDKPDTQRILTLAMMNADLKALTGVIGWLASSLSGIVPLFYAAGYLCTKSHLDMLGIELFSGLVFAPYVEAGAKFFYVTVFLVVENVFIMGLAVGCVALIVLAVHWATKRFCQPERDKALMRYGQLLALVLFVIWIGYRYDTMFAPIQVSGLLNSSSQAESSGTDISQKQDTQKAALISVQIKNNKKQALQREYANQATKVGLVFCVLLLYRRYSPQSILEKIIHPLAYIPLVMIFVLYVFVLPLNYGVMIMSNTYAEVNISTKKGTEKWLTLNPFYLVHKGDKSMILWNDQQKASFVVPTSDVTTLEVIRHSSLFSDVNILTDKKGATP